MEDFTKKILAFLKENKFVIITTLIILSIIIVELLFSPAMPIFLFIIIFPLILIFSDGGNVSVPGIVLGTIICAIMYSYIIYFIVKLSKNKKNLIRAIIIFIIAILFIFLGVLSFLSRIW